MSSGSSYYELAHATVTSPSHLVAMAPLRENYGKVLARRHLAHPTFLQKERYRTHCMSAHPMTDRCRFLSLALHAWRTARPGAVAQAMQLGGQPVYGRPTGSIKVNRHPSGKRHAGSATPSGRIRQRARSVGHRHGVGSREPGALPVTRHQTWNTRFNPTGGKDAGTHAVRKTVKVNRRGSEKRTTRR